MDIGCNVTFGALKAANLHVLAKRKEYFLNSLLNGTLAVGNGSLKESVNICRSLFNNGLNNFLGKIFERLALCNEVGFAVDFNKCAALSVAVCSNNALGSNSC